MSSPNRASRPSWGFYGLGALWMGLAGIHLFTERGGLSTVLEAFIIVILAGSIAYSGYDLVQRDFSRRGSMQAFKQTCLAICAFMLLATAIAFIWSIERGAYPPDMAFMIIFAGSLGGAVGGRASLYSVQSREELEQNQDLTKLLKVNERLLRHNLRNELAIALGYLETLEERYGTTEETDLIRTHLRNLLDLSQRARKIVSIWETDSRIAFPVRPLLADRVCRLQDRYPETAVSLTVEEDYRIVGHPALPSALDEILENAVVHTRSDVEIAVTCYRSTHDGDVVIEVADTGSGLNSLEKRVLFQPVETPLEHSQGLGLWLVYWTLAMSDGDLDFRENSPQGTVVELRLHPLSTTAREDSIIQWQPRRSRQPAPCGSDAEGHGG